MLQQLLDASGYKLWRTMPASANVVTMPADATEQAAPAAGPSEPVASGVQPEAGDAEAVTLPNWADLLGLPWFGNNSANADAADRPPHDAPTQNKDFTDDSDVAGAQTQPALPQR